MNVMATAATERGAQPLRQPPAQERDVLAAFPSRYERAPADKGECWALGIAAPSHPHRYLVLALVRGDCAPTPSMWAGVVTTMSAYPETGSSIPASISSSR